MTSVFLQAYWTATPIHQNYNSTEVVWKGSIGSGPNRKGDNGWQVNQPRVA
jgi:hypothetical protein